MCLDLMDLGVRIPGTVPHLGFIIVFKITIRQVAIVLGVGAGVGGECAVDVPYLTLRESVREHFEVVLPDVNHCRYSSHLHVEK